MKRFLCSLRGHQEHFRAFTKTTIIDTDSGKWVSSGEVSCWCGKIRYLEGTHRPDHRCALCGNKIRELVPVGTGDTVCERCAGVIQDRARNASHGPSLLPAMRATWHRS